MVAQSGPYSLLITDDDQNVREGLRRILEPEGFRTFLAESGEEAIDIVQDRQVHLALLDQQLPRLTGLETLRILRQINAILPVILVTADATERLMREALSARAFSVIPKPVSRNLVVYVVQRALSHAYRKPLRRPSHLPGLPQESDDDGQGACRSID